LLHFGELDVLLLLAIGSPADLLGKLLSLALQVKGSLEVTPHHLTILGEMPGLRVME
jgi:hypothetical protein